MVVKHGDTVLVNYTGTLKDGSVFDTNETDNKEALEFTVGKSQIIKGFDNALIGMQVGEVKNINLMPEEAYGNRNDELIQKVPTEQIPKDAVVNSLLRVQTQDGKAMNAIIIEKKDDITILDLNHPLAGLELNFKITLLEIK